MKSNSLEFNSSSSSSSFTIVLNSSELLFNLIFFIEYNSIIKLYSEHWLLLSTNKFISFCSLLFITNFNCLLYTLKSLEFFDIRYNCKGSHSTFVVDKFCNVIGIFKLLLGLIVNFSHGVDNFISYFPLKIP